MAPKEKAESAEASQETQLYMRPGATQLIAAVLHEPRCCLGLLGSKPALSMALQLLRDEMPGRQEVELTPMCVEAGLPSVTAELACFVEASRDQGRMCIFDHGGTTNEGLDFAARLRLPQRHSLPSRR